MNQKNKGILFRVSEQDWKDLSHICIQKNTSKQELLYLLVKQIIKEFKK